MGGNMTLEKAAVYYSSSVPIGAYLTGLAAFGFLIFKLNEFIKSEKRLRQNIKKTLFTIDGKKITADGFIDSGNTLFADELPVCFVSNKKLITQLKNEIASATVNGEKIISGEYMTVAGSSAFYGIEKEIQVGEQIEKAVLTVSKAETSRYDIILNAVFMEENYENN